MALGVCGTSSMRRCNGASPRTSVPSCVSSKKSGLILPLCWKTLSTPFHAVWKPSKRPKAEVPSANKKGCHAMLLCDANTAIGLPTCEQFRILFVNLICKLAQRAWMWDRPRGGANGQLIRRSTQPGHQRGCACLWCDSASLAHLSAHTRITSVPIWATQFSSGTSLFPVAPHFLSGRLTSLKTPHSPQRHLASLRGASLPIFREPLLPLTCQLAPIRYLSPSFQQDIGNAGIDCEPLAAMKSPTATNPMTCSNSTLEMELSPCTLGSERQLRALSHLPLSVVSHVVARAPKAKARVECSVRRLTSRRARAAPAVAGSWPKHCSRIE